MLRSGMQTSTPSPSSPTPTGIGSHSEVIAFSSHGHGRGLPPESGSRRMTATSATPALERSGRIRTSLTPR